MNDGHPRTAVVVLAAGAGSRVGQDVNKALLPLGGMPVFAWSLQTAADVPGVVRVVLVVAERDRSRAELALRSSRDAVDVDVVVGGDNRHESERRALEWLAVDIEGGALDVVAMHDAARPLASSDLMASVIATAHRRGGAIPVRPQPAVVAADGTESRATESGKLVAVQTPQAFRASPLLAAYRSAHAHGFIGTDTAGCVEAFSDLEVVGVPGAADNIKITFADDFAVAARLLEITRGVQPAPEGRRGR